MCTGVGNESWINNEFETMLKEVVVDHFWGVVPVFFRWGLEEILNRTQDFWYRSRNLQLPVHEVFLELSNVVIVDLSKLGLVDLQFFRKLQDICLYTLVQEFRLKSAILT
jgi:hypothetical protein